MIEVYLLDTTVWIDLLRTNSPSIRRKLSAHSKSALGLSIITACELQYGLERRAVKHPHLRAQEQHLLSAILAPFDVFPIDHTVAEIYGRVRTVLENAGTAIGSLDTFIAAQSLALGATLVTSNTKEFARVPGLQIEDWR
jgi:tRNA(fMet)-specific endonuclease VapC